MLKSYLYHYKRERYTIDPSKAIKEFGWKPTTMFKDGIKLTIKWYQDNKEWLDECTSGAYQEYYQYVL